MSERDEEQLRLHLEEETVEESDKSLLDKLEVAVQMLHHARNTRGDVDSSGIAIAITHIETALLWIKDAIKVSAD
jgi:hypothetical protein